LPPAQADYLVFGSFRSPENAANWAQKLESSFATMIRVAEYTQDGSVWYRVRSEDLDAGDLDALGRRARVSGIQFWKETVDRTDAAPAPSAIARAASPSLGAVRVAPPSRVAQALPLDSADSPDQPDDPSDADLGRFEGKGDAVVDERFDWNVGMQTRAFADTGDFGQERFEGSVSLMLEYYRSWDRDRQSLTVTPFFRADSADDERTHADVRELFYTRVGEDWDVHVGAKRVFWGVTEFHHLIDVINQTDLVENIDTEDKLGQPMVQLSLVRDWGIVDLYALPYFRERTFPGDDGRLRAPFPIHTRARYESSSAERHLDAAIRWSHYVGPWEIGVSHFSGTSRDPILEPVADGDGNWSLRPYYPLIDQTAIDTQAIFGDWAFKFEGFRRSGFGEGYTAFNVGFERTLVGVVGTRADLGIVGEYMYDDRGDDAFNTLFEHDVAIGARLRLNDMAGSEALLGIIFDTDNSDRFLSLEASRRIGAAWLVALEGRAFSGGTRYPETADVAGALSMDYKSAILQSEDYLQLELKKFF
jgi:hypothetical protein